MNGISLARVTPLLRWQLQPKNKRQAKRTDAATWHRLLAQTEVGRGGGSWCSASCGRTHKPGCRAGAHPPKGLPQGRAWRSEHWGTEHRGTVSLVDTSASPVAFSHEMVKHASYFAEKFQPGVEYVSVCVHQHAARRT